MLDLRSLHEKNVGSLGGKSLWLMGVLSLHPSLNHRTAGFKCIYHMYIHLHTYHIYIYILFILFKFFTVHDSID